MAKQQGQGARRPGESADGNESVVFTHPTQRYTDCTGFTQHTLGLTLHSLSTSENIIVQTLDKLKEERAVFCMFFVGIFVTISAGGTMV